MAAIKSFTSLEQSKMLAKILKPESADMCWEAIYASPKDGIIEYADKPTIGYIKHCLPAWSLAALLDVLPDEVGDNYYLTLDKEGKEYCCCYEDCNGNSFRHCFSDNPVDACVEMIIRLNELKIL